MRYILIAVFIFNVYFSKAEIFISGINNGDCQVTFIMLDNDKNPVNNVNIKILDSEGRIISECTTSAQGRCSLTLLSDLTYTLDIRYSGKQFSADFYVPEGETYELQLVLEDALQNDTDEKCLVTFEVTDEYGIAEGVAMVTLKYNGKNIYEGITDIDGKCSTTVDQHITYDVVIDKFGKSFPLKLEMPEQSILSEYNLKIKIKVVEEYIETYTLENVYFDYNKWDLKEESYPSLNKLYDNLKANPQMRIELAGHTDSDGDDRYNMQLSQRRADAVKNYLVKKGISAHRILTKGYGRIQPLVPNDTPENKAKNRRTEVRIIGQ